MTDTPTLSDGAIVLNALRPEDVSAIVAADDEATRWAWGRREPLTLDTGRALVDEAALGWANGSLYRFAIRRADALDYLGQLDLWPRWRGGGGRIGVIVAPDHRRGGVARRAMTLGSRYAFDVIGWPSLMSDVHPDNLASVRLVESLGFRRWDGDSPTDKGQLLWTYLLHRDGDALPIPR